MIYRQRQNLEQKINRITGMPRMWNEYFELQREIF